jgi:hypothetical protein
MRVTVKPALLLAMALSMGPLASLTSVPAAATTFGCGGAGVTFDDLAGNSIACNGVTFSNFANFSSFGDFGANAPDATEVVVVALISATGQTQLVFSSDDWVVLAGQTMNTSLTYSLLGARPIDEVEGGIGPSEGDVSSNASVFSSTNVSLATILTSTGFPIADSPLTPAQSSLNISASLGLITSSNGPGAGVSLFSQAFTLAPVPEPSTWAMMLIGFAGLAYAGYRRSRQLASPRAEAPARARPR